MNRAELARRHVDDYVPAPESVDDLAASHQIEGTLHQEDQEVHARRSSGTGRPRRRNW